MHESGFGDKTFSALPERCRLMTAVIRRHVAIERPLRILDIGCGTGQQLFELARVLPHADLVGVDISEPNIRRARTDLCQLPCKARISFIASDYMALRTASFDVIIADSTLQNMDVPTEALFAKISADLRPEGLLVNSMPNGCLYNRVLWLIRRVLRWQRGPLADRLILSVAYRLYGESLSKEALRERVHYMYLLPQRFTHRTLHETLEADYGLRMIKERPVPQVSLAQPKHVLTVYRKRR